MRVLLIEDDRTLGEAVQDHVSASGHAVDWATSLSDARGHLAVAAYQLILLDLHLPDGDGRNFLGTLRQEHCDVPVIILTARDQLSDRIAGLNAGADDYLVKPFSLAELSARLAAVVRRYAGNPNPLVHVGALEIDQAARRIRLRGRGVALTAREWAVLEQFLQRRGSVIAKDRIEDALYAFGSEIESNTVEVYVSRLRRKIGRETIRTVRGVGYCMDE